MDTQTGLQAYLLLPTEEGGGEEEAVGVVVQLGVQTHYSLLLSFGEENLHWLEIYERHQMVVGVRPLL